jgi:hypothetical protein
MYTDHFVQLLARCRTRVNFPRYDIANLGGAWLCCVSNLYRSNKKEFPMSRKPLKQAAAALLLTCGIALNPVPALAATTVIDFSLGLPAGGTAPGGTVVVDGYRFASDTGSVSVGFIGSYSGINFGYGLTTGSFVPFSVSRVDHQTFDLQGFTIFAGNILTGGAIDFEITPFDMNGNELAPVAFSAGQFWTAYTKTGANQFSTVPGQSIFSTSSGPLSNLSKLNFAFGGADHFTAFSFSSAASAAPIPEPETYAMMLAGLGLLGFAARRRKQHA